jgi:hypothetical protein
MGIGDVPYFGPVPTEAPDDAKSPRLEPGYVAANVRAANKAKTKSKAKNANPQMIKNNGQTQKASQTHNSPRRNAVTAIAIVSTTATMP